MKYKLISKTTDEEHLCDKVTIDGFDSPIEAYLKAIEYTIKNLI